MDDAEKDKSYSEFGESVNMAPKEIEDWLKTKESRSVGDSDDGSESTGHKSGWQIVKIKRTNKADLSDAQYVHMRKVVGYIHRHMAQRPAGDIEDTDWRYSLMNWGHDPMAED